MNYIIAQWNQQEQLFAKNLEDLKAKPAKKIVHDLRVSIKKLRSYLDLRKELAGKEWKPHANKMREFFGVLGKYRDLQMSIALFAGISKKKNIVLPSFDRYTRNILALNKHWLLETARDGSILKELTALSTSFKSDMQKFTDEELTQNINDICREELSDPKLSKEEFRKKPHKNRKDLKKIYYWLTVSANQDVLKENEMKRLHKCLDQLGKWQDHFVLAASLRLFRKQFLIKETDKYKQAKSLEEFVKNERDNYLDKAISSRH